MSIKKLQLECLTEILPRLNKRQEIEKRNSKKNIPGAWIIEYSISTLKLVIRDFLISPTLKDKKNLQIQFQILTNLINKYYRIRKEGFNHE